VAEFGIEDHATAVKLQIHLELVDAQGLPREGEDPAGAVDARQAIPCALRGDRRGCGGCEHGRGACRRGPDDVTFAQKSRITAASSPLSSDALSIPIVQGKRKRSSSLCFATHGAGRD
jgi:hypothetical protein